MTQPEASPQPDQLEQIDRAIARDIERRRKEKALRQRWDWVYWFLLVCAVALMGLAVSVASREVEDLASDLVETEAFPRAVAEAVESNPVLEDSVQLAVNEAASRPGFAETLLANPGFRVPVTEIGREAAAASLREPRLRTVIEQAATAAVATDWPDRMASAETALSVQKRRTDGLSERVNQISAATETLQAMEKKVQTLEETVASQQKLLDQLATGPRSETATSFLLKERETTLLSGPKLLIALGKRLPGRIENVRVASGSERVYPTGTLATDPGVTVLLGESFEFEDKEGQRYRAALTSAQERFLARDLVVLSLLRLPPKTP